MKTLTVILFAVIFFAGCKEEEVCEKYNYGSYCFENKYTEHVEVEIDGAVVLYLDPFEKDCVDMISVGRHDFEAHEVTFTLPAVPRRWTGTIDVIQCTTGSGRLI